MVSASRLSPVVRSLPLGAAWASVLVIALWPVARDQYLYASTLCTLGLFVWFLHVQVFEGIGWRAPAEVQDRALPSGWRHWSALLLGAAAAAAAVLTGLWWTLGKAGSGGWFAFYAVLFTVFIVGTWRWRAFLDVRSAVLAALAMDVVLAAYEHLLLGQGTGWDYHGTDIYSLFHVPVENMLFVYPMASAVCSLLVSALLTRWNRFRAFWSLMAVLSVVFVAVEFLGIWVFELWTVEEFANKSVFPFLRTNLEEFVYYFLFQGLSLLVYLWCHVHLRPGEVR